MNETARAVADQIVEAARSSGPDPIAWVTGNRYVPAARSFSEMEEIWQSSGQEEFIETWEEVENLLHDANVAVECPDYENALYAVDLSRFEYQENEDAEYLQEYWVPVEKVPE